MANESALVLATRINHELNGMLASLDIDIIGRETSKIIVAIKRLAADARLDIRDYEMSDSRVEMLENAEVAIKRLQELRVQILKVSEHGIFSAIDIAQLSAQLDEIVDQLR